MANKRLTTEEWIRRIPEEQKRKFDYSKTVYTRMDEKVTLICKMCRTEFMQRPDSHERGSDCPTCIVPKRGTKRSLGKEKFIEKARLLVPEDYDYSLVEYKNTYTKIDIICNIDGHGIFQVTPRNLLQGNKCQKCMRLQSSIKRTKTQDQFISQLEKQNAQGITYELVEYKNDRTKVMFNCTAHGPFATLPQNFLSGTRCPDCAVSGYRTSKPGRLYILSDGLTTKIGITNLTPEIRARSVAISGGPKMSVIADMYFENGRLPLQIESASLRYLRGLYAQPTEKFDGRTECFLNVDIQKLLQFISPLATNPESEQSDHKS